MPIQMVIACTSPMSRQANTATTALLSIISLIAITTYHRVDAAACSASEYCPDGWSVQRKANYDPTTCDPMQNMKCDKPYQCVHSSCGISFCCAHKNALNEWKKEEEMKREMEEEERYEL
ncbi:unnamed protein product [Cylicocyclus nassatus]|uniref:Uncharacterized protein n=1 Tax=Cylicocyclus nassatus TaxID=53992 RepID=A0AA36GF52_CYLNA|nr:unnamed protein product [Cylicocyclus nassatus]